ncbi:uncharacterized protein EDB91DRAFT_1107738 [Suillus paluster]|uniref:uncharacterized protein n=1 Tax=Suillus paluster TaxID=48578 RepID=UPI001B883BBC|nr:uncharacterized protein EDB91DRAFT_1107738 [Suillus paluster]KAG1750494.1 hypothetical protein EDB91DRAFT_1107738 [Suillus paluster]
MIHSCEGDGRINREGTQSASPADSLFIISTHPVFCSFRFPQLIFQLSIWSWNFGIIMKSLTSPKASSRPILRITVPKFKNTTSLGSMALVLRPSSSSAFSWRRLLRPLRKRKSSPNDEVLLHLSSPSSMTLVGSPTEGECTSPKMVRFDDSPTYFGTRRRLRSPKSPAKGALRSCLVVNNTDPFTEFLSNDADDISVYEDCLTTYPGFFRDMEDLLEREFLEEMKIEKSRTPSWELTEFGCTKIDPEDYLSYCLFIHAEKKRRAETEGWRKVVYDHPMTLRWPSREITERPVKEPQVFLLTPPRLFVPEPTPVILNWHQRIACDVTDMLVTLCIGLTIHMCIYIWGIYCFFSGDFGDEEE